jgi:farnesyl diphosphate synthase/geranylgeranyl diphosphate synthase type II
LTHPFPAEEYLSAVAARTERWLEALLSARAPLGPPELWEAIRYAVMGGGKRLRPALVLASAEAHGGDVSDGSLATRFAVALELIHTYSLVHDDLPSMDDDDLRRGRPTVHKVHGEATAILVGDALQSMAFSHLLGSEDPRAAGLGRLLSEDALRMVEGQTRDLAGEHASLSEPQVMALMRDKTGALVGAAVAGGALCAGADPAEPHAMGVKLGLAFQIADDLLDLTGDTAALGKRAGKDAAAGKSTLPAVLGVEVARRRAEALVSEALAALEPLGRRAEPLRALARFVLSRGK